MDRREGGLMRIGLVGMAGLRGRLREKVGLDNGLWARLE